MVVTRLYDVKVLAKLWYGGGNVVLWWWQGARELVVRSL